MYRKNKLFIMALSIAFTAVFAPGCDSDDGCRADEATIEVKTTVINEKSMSVTFTPSEGARYFCYAIGFEEDEYRFLTEEGSAIDPGNPGKEVFKYILYTDLESGVRFEGLKGGTEYTIFAQATNTCNEDGKLVKLKVTTKPVGSDPEDPDPVPAK